MSQQTTTTAQQGPHYTAPSGNRWVRYTITPGPPSTRTFSPPAISLQGGSNLVSGDYEARGGIQSLGVPGATLEPMSYNATSKTVGQYTYYRGSQRESGNIVYGGGENPVGVGSLTAFEIYRQYPVPQQTQAAGHAGGAGGAGGLGRGFQNQPAGDSGASGSSGTTGQAGNGGAGGAGGAGGSYGAAGGAATAGQAGTASTSAGASGGAVGSVGAAGNYIEGISNVSFTNNGTVAGGTE